MEKEKENTTVKRKIIFHFYNSKSYFRNLPWRLYGVITELRQSQVHAWISLFIKGLSSYFLSSPQLPEIPSKHEEISWGFLRGSRFLDSRQLTECLQDNIHKVREVVEKCSFSHLKANLHITVHTPVYFHALNSVRPSCLSQHSQNVSPVLVSMLPLYLSTMILLISTFIGKVYRIFFLFVFESLDLENQNVSRLA